MYPYDTCSCPETKGNRVEQVPAYHGLARAFVRTTVDAATPLWHRNRLLEIDLESGQGSSVTISTADDIEAADIVIQAAAPGLAPVKFNIPVSTSQEHLPLAVAALAV